MKFKSSDKDNDDLLNDKNLIKKNRIIGLESQEDFEKIDLNDEEEKNQERRKTDLSKFKKPIIITISLFIFILTSILVIINFFYDKPGKFLSPNTSSSQPFGDIPKSMELDSSNPLIIKGKESFKRGYFNDAIATFNEVVESDASDKDKAIALTYLGMIQDERKNYDMAIDYYSRALKYDKKNSDIYKNMAVAFKHKGDYENAMELAEKAISINSKDVNLYRLLGNIYFEIAKYKDAYEQYEKALEISPENPSILFNMASTLNKVGEEFSAIEYFKKAAANDKIGSIAHRAYSRLGVMYTDRQDYANAEKYLKRAVSIRPNDATNRYYLGIVYLRQNKNDEAIREFSNMESLARDDARLLESLGEAYSKLNDYDRSLDVYNRLLAMNSRNIKVLARIGEIYYKRKDFDKAYLTYEKITMLEPATENARIAYLNMGNILDDAERYDDAVEAYKKALAINNRDHAALYNLGIAYKHSGKPELAIMTWKKAIELKPDDPKFRIAISDYYYENNIFDLAEKEYQNIVELWPHAQDAHFKLATMYYRKGNYQYAAKAYERVIGINDRNDLGRRALSNLAVLNIKLSNDEETYEKSQNLIERALQLEPGDANTLFSMGMIYFNKNEYDKAIDTFYQVIKASRETRLVAESYHQIGKCYYKDKKYKKALQAFTRGLEEDPSNEEMRMNRKVVMQAYESELGR